MSSLRNVFSSVLRSSRLRGTSSRAKHSVLLLRVLPQSLRRRSPASASSGGTITAAVITRSDLAVSRRRFNDSSDRLTSAAMAAHKISDRVMELDKVDFEDAKHSTHFEWVIGFEKTIKELGVAIFETLGVNDEDELQIALSHLEKFQDNLKTKMDAFVKQIADKADVNDSAKTFVAEWVDAMKYQISCKYHLIDGPTAQKVRRSFESPIKHIIICSTHLATLDDDIEYTKFVSDYIKNVVIQSIIDKMTDIKRELETLKKSS